MPNVSFCGAARAATIADRIVFLADGLIVEELAASSHSDVLAALHEVTRRSPPSRRRAAERRGRL